MSGGLYSKLLGQRWDELADTVRELHYGVGVVDARGTFRVRNGSNVLARCLARLAGLPAATDAVKVQLIVTPCPHGQRWRRWFGRTLFATWQRDGRGALIELVGLAELHFQLEVSEGGLQFHAKRAALRVGPVCIAFPKWLAPMVEARETPCDEAVRVSVSVKLPVIGLLIAYEGSLTVLG